jgi:phosphoribosyl 1,2-cyclic phosphodiesterase
MKVKFYGTRGSIPVCDPGFQKFGGNTTCLQITFTDTNRIAILDAGTGLRNLGRDLLAIGHKQEQIVIAFTHFHWDHIQGFPFFAPAYDSRKKITLLTLGRDQTIGNLREIFEVQMQARYYPVQLDHMGANFEFLQIADASKHFTGINNVDTVVTAQRHNHPGGAYSFRVERNGKVLVVCIDVEHGQQIDPRLVELARGADLLVHDAQYTAEELQKRRGWGHSSFDQAMQLAEMAGVKRLALTHHDPDHDDEFLERIEKLCQERFSNTVLAREGMEIPISEAPRTLARSSGRLSRRTRLTSSPRK